MSELCFASNFGPDVLYVLSFSPARRFPFSVNRTPTKRKLTLLASRFGVAIYHDTLCKVGLREQWNRMPRHMLSLNKVHHPLEHRGVVVFMPGKTQNETV